MTTSMRILLSILLLLLPLDVSSASELTLSSKDKVNSADVIVVGQVVATENREIRTWPGLDGKRQLVVIKFKVERVLLGASPRDIFIRGFSTSYIVEGAISFSTAGFSGARIENGRCYLAYLTRGDRGYQIAGDSNQYFEEIEAATNQIQADGQTNERVSLTRKLRKISSLAVRKQKDQQRAEATAR